MEVSGQLHAQGRNPWYTLDRRLGGPQSRRGCDGENESHHYPRRELNPSSPARKGNCKGKGKVKLSLCLTKNHAMKKYWGRRRITPRILDLGTRQQQHRPAYRGRDSFFLSPRQPNRLWDPPSLLSNGYGGLILRE